MSPRDRLLDAACELARAYDAQRPSAADVLAAEGVVLDAARGFAEQITYSASGHAAPLLFAAVTWWAAGSVAVRGTRTREDLVDAGLLVGRQELARRRLAVAPTEPPPDMIAGAVLSRAS